MSLLRSLWLEPAPPAPPRGRFGAVPGHDVAAVALLVPLVVVEGLARDDVAIRPVAIFCALVVALLLLARRARPFVAFCAAFGLTVVVNVAAFAFGATWEGLYSTIAILLLPYSLFRWGAGRDALLGLGVLAIVYASSLLTGEMGDAGEHVGAAVVLLLPAAVGASLRFRAQAQTRAVETARSLERERLARDLHDTVAHHVTAIVLQAQAGQVLTSTKPAAAAQAFVAIEAEAAAALAELRGLLGVLRRPGDAPLQPQQGLGDLHRLARILDDGRVVTVTGAGSLAGVSATVQGAVFRLAQESVTNALRHSKRATRIEVRVEGEAGGVRLRVDDDGAPVTSFSAGFGLAGMAERARLLGGSFHAGPRCIALSARLGIGAQASLRHGDPPVPLRRPAQDDRVVMPSVWSVHLPSQRRALSAKNEHPLPRAILVRRRRRLRHSPGRLRRRKTRPRGRGRGRRRSR